MAPLKPRLQFDLRNCAGLFFHFDEKLHPKLLMGHFPSTETEGHLDFVAFFEEFLDRTHLNLVVMRVDIRAKLDFLHLNGLLLFARFCSFFLGLELILPEIHDLANRDFTVGSNLNEIEPGFLSLRQRVALIDVAVIFPLFVDQLDIAGNNGVIYARPLFSGCASYWTAYLTLLSLLNLLPARNHEAQRAHIK